MTIYLSGDAERYRNYGRAVEEVGMRLGSDYHACDGLLLPGGGDVEPWRYGQENAACRNLEPERDQREWELLEWFTARERPILGICRGMQMINVFFGGTLVQDLAGHDSLRGGDRLHVVKTAPSILQEVCGERSVVNSAHHQAVDRLGEGLQAVQWAMDGVVEGIVHRELPVAAVQWHPERLVGVQGILLIRKLLRGR